MAINLLNRIINFAIEFTSIPSDAYIAVDSETEGSGKFKAKKLALASEVALKIGDSPKDGNSYVRKNGTWKRLTEGSVEEAPMDGEAYVRVGGEWVNASFVFEKQCADEVLDAGDISILADEVLSESGEEMVLVEE